MSCKQIQLKTITDPQPDEWSLIQTPSSWEGPILDAIGQVDECGHCGNCGRLLTKGRMPAGMAIRCPECGAYNTAKAEA